MSLLIGPSSTAASDTQSVLFDGTGNDEYITIDITGSPAPSALLADESATVDGWVRPTSANNNTGSDAFNGNLIFDADNFSGNGGGFLFGVQNNVLSVGVNFESTSTGQPFGYQTFQGSTTINDDAWHFIRVCINAVTGAITAYVDETREINATYSNIASCEANFHWLSGGVSSDQLILLGGEKLDALGTGTGNADGGFHGRISEIRITPSVLSTGSTITVPTSPLDGSGSDVAYYAFDEGTGSTVADSGGGTNSDGTITGAVWSSDGPY